MSSYKSRRFGIKTLLLATDTDSDEESEPPIAVPYLPDNVIEKIMSFLPIKAAARANTVSKQWASLWPCFPVIHLKNGDFNAVDYIHCPLLRRCKKNSKQKVLEKLRIRVEIDFGRVNCMIREWVDFALKRCVKELDICSLDQRIEHTYLISHDVLTSKFLTSLKLEKVGVYATNGSVSLPCLKSMSFTNVLFLDDPELHRALESAICSLISGCPNIEHLSLDRCRLGRSGVTLIIDSNSLKSLEIMNCHSKSVLITATNLESFKFYSDCNCTYHKEMYVWECEKLKNVDISCKGLKLLLLHIDLQAMENSIFTPNLEFFEFSGYLKHKIHFVEAPSNLIVARVRILKTLCSFEHYSALINFLQSFDCSKKVKIHIEVAEGITVPEQWRIKWSPPLPSIDQLQLYCSDPLGETLRTSLIWMAPSAKILPVLDHEDDSESEHYRNESESESEDEDVDDYSEGEDEVNDDNDDG